MLKHAQARREGRVLEKVRDAPSKLAASAS